MEKLFKSQHFFSLGIFLVVVISFQGCTSNCDCSLIYNKKSETGTLWYNRDNDKSYSGICTTKFGNGEIKSESKFEKGKLVYEKKWFESKQLETDKLYDAAGDLESEKGWYKNGTLALDHQYKNGKPVSRKDWFENGVLGQEWTFFFDGNFQGDPRKGVEYYDKDKIKKEWEMVEESGIFHVTYSEYYPNGSVKDNFTFSNNFPINLKDINTDNIQTSNNVFKVENQSSDIDLDLHLSSIFSFHEFYKYLVKGSMIFLSNGQLFLEIIDPFKANRPNPCVSCFQPGGTVDGLIYNEKKRIIGFFDKNYGGRVYAFYHLENGQWVPDSWCNDFKDLPIDQSTSFQLLYNHWLSHNPN